MAARFSRLEPWYSYSLCTASFDLNFIRLEVLPSYMGISEKRLIHYDAIACWPVNRFLGST